MAHIIAEPCVGTKDTACVAVCRSIAFTLPKTARNFRLPRCSTSIQMCASIVDYVWMNVR